MRNKKSGKGFTIVELLIVISILAVLYNITAINVLGLQNEARYSRIKGDLKTLRLAIDTYIKNKGVCPQEDNYQRALILSKPKILEGNLFDPFGATVNTLYSYSTSANNQYYIVYSVGMRRNGSAGVDNRGELIIEGSVIYETNGYYNALDK